MFKLSRSHCAAWRQDRIRHILRQIGTTGYLRKVVFPANVVFRNLLLCSGVDKDHKDSYELIQRCDCWLFDYFVVEYFQLHASDEISPRTSQLRLTLYWAQVIILNNMKSVHWPVMGGLLHLVQRWGNLAGPQPAQAFLCCTKCNSPPKASITVLLYFEPLLCGFNVPIKG